MTEIEISHPSGLSYAGARLRLGMTGVGLWVLIALVLLLTGLASTISLAQGLLGYLVLSMPLDLLGGQILPYLWKQSKLPLLRWSLLYLKGLTLQLSLLGVSSASIHFTNGFVGPNCSVALFILLSLLLLCFQLSTLRWLGIAGEQRDGFCSVQAADLRFSGGLTGLPWPGCESPVMPAHWSQSEVPQGFEAHLERRRLLSSSGARAVGALSAIAFNALGLRLVLAMTSGSIVSLACGFTLWSFVGLLLLPSLSRPGVLAADISVVRQLGPKQARHWLSWLEGFQDEDAVRPNWTERIFHPIPQWSLRSRFARIGNAWWPWNIARYALLTSMLAGGLLSRAVHCNCGRPELWFWPPND
jgi:hypothetical protein